MTRDLTTIMGFASLLVAASLAAADLGGESAVFHCESAGYRKTPCEVALVPLNATSQVLLFPSDNIVEIPTGTYDLRASAKGESLGSNPQLTSGFGPSPAGELRRVFLELLPGGIVFVDSTSAPPTGAVQLLSFTTGRVDTIFLQRERRIPFVAGQTIAIGFRGPDQILGITRPWELVRGATKTIGRVDPPTAGKGHLLVRLRYPPEATLDAQDATVQLVLADRAIDPLVTTNKSLGSSYAAFYDLSPGKYDVTISSKTWRASTPTTMEVRAGETRIDDHILLLSKPSLHVSLKGEKSTVEGPHALSLYQCERGQLGPATGLWPDLGRCSTVIQRDVALDTVLLNLEPEWYFLAVRTGTRTIGRQVDLTAGSVEQELWISPVRVYGHVTREGKPVPARLVFEDRQENIPIELQSDNDGGYEVALVAEHEYYVRVGDLASSADEASRWFFYPEGKDDIVRDFDLPAGSLKITVLDEKTRDPISDASVAWVGDVGKETRTTDASGEAILPAHPPGPFRCSAAAKNYRTQISEFKVKETILPQQFEILLKPLADELSFHVRLPDGRPASGAIMAAGYQGGVVFRERNTCDLDGICRLAERASSDETLYLAHPEAGLAVTLVSTALDQGEITMRPPGGSILAEVIRGPKTEDGTLMVAVHVDGWPVPEPILATLATLLNQPYRIYAMSGYPQEFVLPGLPAGSGIILSVFQVATDENAGERITTQLREVSFELPVSGPVAVQLE